MSAEILIALGGLILAALTYFAGVYRTERKYKKDDREARVASVVQAYMEFRRTGKTAGLDGLQKAGAANLHTSEEVHQAIDRIIGHSEIDPLGSMRQKLEGRDLVVFFTYAARNRINFHRADIGKEIENSGA